MTSRAAASSGPPAGSRSPPLATAASSSVDRRRLGARDELVDLEVARRRLADEQRPGHVAAVARDLRPEVEQQDRAVQDRPVARRAVRQRRLGAGQAGDVEGERLRAAGPHQPLEAEREVAPR